jgi:hypothetical protein
MLSVFRRRHPSLLWDFGVRNDFFKEGRFLRSATRTGCIEDPCVIFVTMFICYIFSREGTPNQKKSTLSERQWFYSFCSLFFFWKNNLVHFIKMKEGISFLETERWMKQIFTVYVTSKLIYMPFFQTSLTCTPSIIPKYLLLWLFTPTLIIYLIKNR